MKGCASAALMLLQHHAVVQESLPERGYIDHVKGSPWAVIQFGATGGRQPQSADGHTYPLPVTVL